jgi:RNA polymerase sigma-70 factor, ECF subfamily
MKVSIVYKFERIYVDESDAIFRFCLVRLSNREQALDITQETFLHLWQSLLENKEIENDKAFLFKIARNLIIDWYRKKKSVSLEDMKKNENNEDNEYDIPDGKTLNDVDLGAEGRYLINKIDNLNPGYRQPVYLRFVEGLSPTEIGKIMGISSNAASVRVNRGLEELRKKTGYENK